ncbi:type 1 fimbriae regulatory protein FimB [Methylomagnum ishizawai]|uniref:Type 1 fimbriae regulatory protein FimB n=1 Tax=Methylomagnum ishizawai TaxID=1760988 RepID=A0A1Y6DBA3_9GAMM|nr:tyrosine-type recombinase/integrase [Methylomagnum ishizawai]SMF97883.1 type 1 fimbriae regulatory protein FimB [Methylomagnum ishizawai]
MFRSPPQQIRGVAACLDAQILDKMNKASKDDRRHLTQGEVQRLIAATQGSRNEARDRFFLLLMFRHGLRVSEACGLRLSQLDLENRVLHVARLKRGLSTTHPLRVDEVRLAKAWLAERARMGPETDAVFVSERRGPLSRKTAWRFIRAYGERAELLLSAHPHMLRHACGFALADQGADTRLIQDYLGHRNIQHTVRYTATNPARFGRLWR